MSHANYFDRDWSSHYSEYYERAANMSANLWQMPAPDGLQFQGPPLLRYQAWYIHIGMASVYLQGDYGDFLRQRVLTDDGFTPTGRRHAFDVSNALKTIFIHFYIFL